MKKLVILIATVSFACAACERHPADQLPKKEGDAKEETAKPAESPEKPSPSPESTPKS
jgi:hypothetical protein